MNARWLARVAASAAVRRVVYLVIAALLGLFAVSGKAQAAFANPCPATSNTCNQEQAWTAAVAYADADGPALCVTIGGGSSSYLGHLVVADGVKRYKAGVSCSLGGSTAHVGYTYWTLSCPVDSVWNEATHQCFSGCQNQPPIFNKAAIGADEFCDGGCAYRQKIEYNAAGSGVSVCLGGGPDMYCGASQWQPTGESCINGKTPMDWAADQQTCKSFQGSGSHNECVLPDGTHCVTAENSGKRLCWKPGEMGARQTADGKLGADRQLAPNANTPPPGMENPTEAATNQGGTVINGDTVNTTIYNGTGNKGSQGNTGVDDDKDGDGQPDGDGKGGEGEGDDDGVGDSAGDGGTLYEGTGKTVSTVFAAFKARLLAAPLVTAGDTFLQVTVTASCPAFSVPETTYWPAMSFDYHCNGELADALSYGGFLVLAIAAFVAYRVAMH